MEEQQQPPRHDIKDEDKDNDKDSDDEGRATTTSIRSGGGIGSRAAGGG